MAPDEPAYTEVRVNLTDKTLADIEALVRLTGDVRVDVINRGLQTYLLFVELANKKLGSYRLVADLGDHSHDLLVMTMEHIPRRGGFEVL